MDFSAFASMSLVDSFTGPFKAITAQMGLAKVESTGLAESMGALTKSMLPAAAAAGVVVGGLVAAALSTRETSSALGQLRSLGVKDLAAVEQAGLEFSNNFAGTTKAQFIAAAYDIKSGISSLSDEGVAQYTRLAALTAKATISTASEMTSLFATGYGIYKKMYDKMSDLEFGSMFSAGISAAVQVFKTRGPQMAAAISSLGASATNAGVEMAEQFSVLGGLQQTLGGERAGTAYAAFIRDAAKAGKELGLNFIDASGNLKSMPEILGVLHGKFGENLDAMEKMKLQKAFSDESLRVVDLMYSKTGELTANIKTMREAMAKGETFTLEMAQTMNQGLGASIIKAQQRFKNLVEIIGGVVASTLTKGINVVSSLILALQGFAASPAGQAIVRIAGAVGTAVLLFTSWSAVTWAVAKALPYLSAMLGAVGWPVWLLIGAVAALMLAWETNFGGMRDTISAWWNTIALVVQGVIAVFRSLSGTTGAIKGELAEKIEAAGLVGFVTTAGKIVFRVKELFGGMAQGVWLALCQLWSVLSPIVSAIGAVFGWLGYWVGQVTGWLGKASAASDVSGWVTLGNVLGYVVGVFAWGFAIAKAYAAAMWIVKAATVAWTVVQWVLNAAMSANPIGLIILAVVALIAVIAPLVYWWDEISAAFQGALGAITGWFRGVWDYISSIDLFECGVKLWNTFTEGLRSVAMAPVRVVQEGLQAVRDMLPFSDAKAGPLSNLTLSGQRLMQTLGAGVAEAAPALAGAVEAAFGDLAPALSFEGVAEPAFPVAARGERAGGQAQARQVIVRIDNLALPGVRDAEGFITEITKLAEQYDA